MNNIKSFLTKDIKSFNKAVLSLGCIAFLLCVGIISYKSNKSFALFSGEVSGNKQITMHYSSYTKNFSYKGQPEEYKVGSTGYYYIELEGASGGPGHTDGNNTNNYGYGAKTSGYVYLEQGTKLYFYVGGKGGTPTTKTCTNTTATEATGTGGTGGYNGGGAGGNDSCQSTNAANDAAGGGGGATDVRLEGGSWDNTASLTSRIMVAGGGGGGTYTGNAIQGSGGGALYGDQEKRPSNRTTYLSTMPSQTSGYAFGKGGPGMYCTDNTGSGGHGGGYYGAKTGTSCDNRAGGIGGSSYISGYAGVNSVSAAGTVSHNLTTKHYSNIYFIGADIIPDQNDGNGHASIRFVGEKPQRKNTN